MKGLFELVPTDITKKIISELDNLSLVRITKTCRFFRDLNDLELSFRYLEHVARQLAQYSMKFKYLLNIGYSLVVEFSADFTQVAPTAYSPAIYGDDKAEGDKVKKSVDFICNLSAYFPGMIIKSMSYLEKLQKKVDNLTPEQKTRLQKIEDDRIKLVEEFSALITAVEPFGHRNKAISYKDLSDAYKLLKEKKAQDPKDKKESKCLIM